MKELRRWSEEGATTEELRILASARSVRPSASSRARMTAALGVGASSLWASSASGATAASSATTLSTGVYLKLLSVVLAVGVAGGAAWHFARPAPAARSSARLDAPMQKAPSVENAPVIASAAADAPARSPAPAASSLATEAGAPAPGGGRLAASRQRGAPAPAASLGLSEEVEALERARKALSTKSPQAALRELHAYNQRFPHGELASEETVLRVQALLARGQNEKAVALADRFAAAHPESPLASRVQELVRSARGKP